MQTRRRPPRLVDVRQGGVSKSGVGTGLGRAAGTKAKILVTGSEQPAGLAAVRALHQAGFEVWAAVESRTALGARSRAVAGLVDVANPRVDPDGFVAMLASAAERLRAAAVLPGNEQSLLPMT